MIPVGGTAVGLAVGVGVAMSIPTRGDKTIGDVAADVGEGIWNTVKGWFGG